ncbi:hypothetical protein B7P43_G14867 [Cryptotermes secundus]|uniref:Uncharacterized protein n=1 Tax=Cryptotermes secundus TaxID=105785 RepID=A0A2J7R9G0_9NEOP|nr:hypothetical protein B7P43_G14867 [Cryptotermes secundus]
MCLSHSHFAQDDRTLGAGTLHQVTSQTWGYPSRNNPQHSAAFSDDAMGVTQIKERFNRFKDGLMLADHRLAICEVADEVGISRGSANMILTEDLGMR